MHHIDQTRSLIILFLIAFCIQASGSSDSGISGIWTLIPDKSEDIDLYNTLTLEIQKNGDSLLLIQTWGGRRSHRDSLNLRTGGVVNQIPVASRIFPSNVFMGVSARVGSVRRIQAVWSEDKNSLFLQEVCPVRGSQGPRDLHIVHSYTLSEDGAVLTYRIQRDSRPENSEPVYVFKRAGSREAWVMYLEDDWSVDGKLPQQAFLISLQGLANLNAPLLYFIYPPAWDFRFTPDVFNYYREDRHFTFQKLRTWEQALNTFREHVRGYVVWDPEVRTSLIVAYTIAGLERSVAVTESMIPEMEAAGLQPVADLRGIFKGLTDAEIYQWAYDRYWPRCSREIIVWLGGEHGRIMKPGVADYGMVRRAFFQDLSTLPDDDEEYQLANTLLSQMDSMALVMGWHSYKKDKERDHVTLVSSHGHRVEGLHTLPNMSFSRHIPLSPGFRFRNNPGIVPGRIYRPEKKIYIACVQTDCLGLGAWNQPGRGEMPYAWEVTMNWAWLAPAMLEFFYSQATPNDYFIGALSGPGYIYPKAVPAEILPGMIREAGKLMKYLDLHVFEIMDYSQGATVEGNTELTRSVADAYFHGMPDAIGFINGYAPAYTFTTREKRPLISYDYYLSPSRPAAAAAADLVELSTINSHRPYFLLMHVRQWSNITRVKEILDLLGPEFEVVPLDMFLKMAGENPTFQERFLEIP
jgi:hypothetical protein